MNVRSSFVGSPVLLARWVTPRVMAVFAAAMVAGCGGSGTAPAGLTTVTETATVSVPASTAPSVAASNSDSASAATASQTAASKVVVPNGVGLDYQSAQDRWRAVGLVVLPAIDATGANRLPVIDSNWVVLAQDLKPGKKVEAGASITATVKKFSDQ